MRFRIPAATTIASLAALAWSAPAHASTELVLIPDLTVTGILLVAFVLLIFPLNALIFKPLFRVLDERDERIAGARRRAEHVQEQAEEALSRYRAAIQDAHEEALAERRARLDSARAEQESIRSEAKLEAEREIDGARDEIRASIDDARASLRESASELAELAAERILGRSVA